jgi:hypothetical protein
VREHLQGIAHEKLMQNSPGAQSACKKHASPAEHPEQSPPQSTAVSLAFKIPSAQLGDEHTKLLQK